MYNDWERVRMREDLTGILLTEETLEERVSQLAAEISRNYAGKDPVIISVLKGSFVFMADLVRRVSIPCTIDFMAVSSYGNGTQSDGGLSGRAYFEIE